MIERNILVKSLYKLLRISTSRAKTEQEKVRAIANIYRTLCRFRILLDHEMELLSEELKKKNVEEYFIKDSMKVVVAKDVETDVESVEVLPFSRFDMRKAIKQYKTRGYVD